MSQALFQIVTDAAQRQETASQIIAPDKGLRMRLASEPAFFTVIFAGMKAIAPKITLQPPPKDFAARHHFSIENNPIHKQAAIKKNSPSFNETH